MPRVVTPRPENADVQYSHWPQRLPRRLAIPATSLWFNLAVSALRYPDKAALVFLGSAMSYRQLHDGAEILARQLQQRQHPGCLLNGSLKVNLQCWVQHQVRLQV